MDIYNIFNVGIAIYFNAYLGFYKVYLHISKSIVIEWNLRKYKTKP